MKYIEGWWLPESDTYFGKLLLEEGHPFQIDRLRTALRLLDPTRERLLAVDIGAHVGMWTKELAGLFKEVHAFEAAADTYNCLQRNLLPHLHDGLTTVPDDVSRVLLHRHAVGDCDGVNVVMVDCVERPGNTGARYMKKGVAQNKDSVQMRTLDSFNLPACDFLKIDVEGAEALVLRGAVNTIAKYKPLVYVEAKQTFGRRFGYDDEEALRMLTAMGARQVRRIKNDYVFSFVKEE